MLPPYCCTTPYWPIRPFRPLPPAECLRSTLPTAFTSSLLPPLLNAYIYISTWKTNHQGLWTLPRDISLCLPWTWPETLYHPRSIDAHPINILARIFYLSLRSSILLPPWSPYWYLYLNWNPFFNSCKLETINLTQYNKSNRSLSPLNFSLQHQVQPDATSLLP